MLVSPLEREEMHRAAPRGETVAMRAEGRSRKARPIERLANLDRLDRKTLLH